MRNTKRIILSILFMVGFILLVSESASIWIFLLSKAVGLLMAFLFFSLWEQWEMNDDPLIKKIMGK